MDKTRMTGKAPAAVLIVAIAATAACGGGSSNVRPSAPEVVAVPVTEWIDNRTAEDLRDHYWYPPEAIRQLLGLAPVADADLADRRSTLARVLEAAQSDAATSRTRLRNVVADEVTIIGERDGITYGRWTDGPAGTLNIEFDWRFAQGLDAAARARMERAGKAWSRRLLDDFEARTVPAGTAIVFDAADAGAEARSETLDMDIRADDVVIAVLYSGTSSRFSWGGSREYHATAHDYEPWFGAIVLSQRHIGQSDVMMHEIGHVLGLTGWPSGYEPASVARYVNTQDHTFDGPHSRRANGGEPVPFRWVDGNNDPLPAGTPGATVDYGHFGVCDSIMAYCRNRREVVGPTELDFAYLADIGYDVLDARTAGAPEVYGYGAWARYSAWGAGVERVLDAPGGSRDALRAGADAFGIAPDATLASVHGVTGTVRWEGTLVGVDLGQPMLPPVTGNAALDVDLETLDGAASFDGLAVHVGGVTRAFRNPALEYAITVAGNGFSDDASRVSGHLFGPQHEEMAGVLLDRSEAVNLLAGFGGTRD